MDWEESMKVLADAMNEPPKAQPGDIHSAALAGDVEEIRRILEQSPEAVNSKDSRGSTPLHAAVNFNQGEAIKFLVASGADINGRSGDEATPLIDAASSGYDKVVFFLIQSGADLSLTDDGGDTPLHWAARKGHHNSVAILLKTGARVNVRNSSGKTPLDLARTMEFPQIVAWLEKLSQAEEPPSPEPPVLEPQVEEQPTPESPIPTAVSPASQAPFSVNAGISSESPSGMAFPGDAAAPPENRIHQSPAPIPAPLPAPAQNMPGGVPKAVPARPVAPQPIRSSSPPAKPAVKAAPKKAKGPRDFTAIRRELVEQVGETQLIKIMTDFTENELSAQPITQAQFLQKVMRETGQNASTATELIIYARTSPEAREIALGTAWQTFYLGLAGLVGGALINFITVYATGYIVNYLALIPALGLLAAVNSGQKIVYVNFPSLKNPFVSILVFIIFLAVFIGAFYLMLR